MRVKDGNKAGLITHLTNEGRVLLKSRMGDFTSGSVRGLIVTAKPRILQEVELSSSISSYIGTDAPSMSFVHSLDL